jgi:hypothetical protein
MWRRRNIDLRDGVIGTCLLIIVLLSGFSPSHRAHDNKKIKVPIGETPASEVFGIETVHFDGLVEHIRKIPNTTPDLLVLTLTKDASSWGHDKDKPLRIFSDFLDLLIATDLDFSCTSLALWTSDVDQYVLFRTATARLNIARVSIFFDPGDTGSGRGDRHQENQSNRRSKIAKFRNNFMLRAIGPEPHLLWIDSDTAQA